MVVFYKNIYESFHGRKYKCVSRETKVLTSDLLCDFDILANSRYIDRVLTILTSFQ